VQIHPGVAADFQEHLNATRTRKQRYVVDENDKLRPGGGPRALDCNSKRHRNGLQRMYRWSSTRSCCASGGKEAIQLQDMLSDHYLSARALSRHFQDEMSRIYVGVSRKDCKKAIELHWKYDLLSTSSILLSPLPFWKPLQNQCL
jgi:hypothetical protein